MKRAYIEMVRDIVESEEEKMKTIEYYMSLPYRMEIIPDMEEGGFSAVFPELPGCLTCADTMDDLVKNVEDAKKSWFVAAIEDGVEIKEPSDGSDFSNYSG